MHEPQTSNFFQQMPNFQSVPAWLSEKKSINTAIYEFIQQIISTLENRNITLGIFLDLSKAYDSLQHDILLVKLERYGVRRRGLDWIKSYLSERKQKVQISREGTLFESHTQTIHAGVPQGSVLGPILFVIYINDISTVANLVNEYIVNFADDTNLLTTSPLYPSLVIQANELFMKIKKYFGNINLILNETKTNMVLFRTKHSLESIPDNIILNDVHMPIQQNTKFLGIYINGTLNWSTHIEHVANGLSKICYAIRVLSKYLDISTIKIIYHANFESTMRYGILFYGSGDLGKVFLIQKTVIRIITKIKYRESCRSKFRENGMMTVFGLYIYECLIFIFKNRDRFPQSVQHTHDTRSFDITYPHHRLTLTEKGPEYRCIKFFNNLPSDMKNIKSLVLFKSKIRKMLIDLEPYSIDDYLS